MTSYVSASLRRIVEDRAKHCCEYCLIHESDTFSGCQVDHVLAEKHGGETTHLNLAFSCAPCNRAKGTDLGSLASDGVLTRFFNPRSDAWRNHFRLSGSRIEAITLIGEVTVRTLRLNAIERLAEREILQDLGRYPPTGMPPRRRYPK